LQRTLTINGIGYNLTNIANARIAKYYKLY